MKETIFTIVAFLIGGMIAGAGIYYLIKEKNDKESRKIYSITTIIGVAIMVGVFIKIAISGF